MALSIKTLGCNGLCRSCYENRIRSVNRDVTYNIDAILRTIEEGHKRSPKSNSPCLHGGEPLMLKLGDLEKILEKIHSLWGRTNIQTNGTLITDNHIELFKRYKTSVGVSIDGDTHELNYGRWNAKKLGAEEIQEMTDKVLYNMKKVKSAGLSLAVIVLLRKYNASSSNILGLIRFLLRLKDEFGVCSVRTNECICYEDEYREEEELTAEELGNAYCKIADVALSDSKLHWQPYRDIVDLLLGYGYNNSTCVFSECDVWKTHSERPIDKDGFIGNCLKGGGAIDGIQVVAADQFSRERYEVLAQVPQNKGGCKDCRYWHICRGGCPGEGLNNDWRNKMRFCEAWKILYAHIDKKLKGITPNIYTAPDIYPENPGTFLFQESLRGSSWKGSAKKKLENIKKLAGKNESSEQIDHGDRPHGDSGHGDAGHGDSGHGDHTDDVRIMEKNQRNREHGDRPHGDAPHGDS